MTGKNKNIKFSFEGFFVVNNYGTPKLFLIHLSAACPSARADTGREGKTNREELGNVRIADLLRMVY